MSRQPKVLQVLIWVCQSVAWCQSLERTRFLFPHLPSTSVAFQIWDLGPIAKFVSEPERESGMGERAVQFLLWAAAAAISPGSDLSAIVSAWCIYVRCQSALLDFIRVGARRRRQKCHFPRSHTHTQTHTPAPGECSLCFLSIPLREPQQ